MTPTLQQKIEEKVKVFEQNFWANDEDRTYFLRTALTDIAREAREEERKSWKEKREQMLKDALVKFDEESKTILEKLTANT